jgi:hypothetical protein
VGIIRDISEQERDRNEARESRGTGDIPSAKDIILEIPFPAGPTERHQFLIDVSFC